MQILIRGEDFHLAPIDTSICDDEPTTGGVSSLVRPAKAQVSIMRPSEIPFENPSSKWPPSQLWVGNNGYSKGKGASYSRNNSSAQDDSSFTPDLEIDEKYLGPPRPERQQYARSAQRTIMVKNLSDRTTHKDIVDFIRGGLILDVYLRLHERSASISFVEGYAAQAFLAYVKRKDIYLHGKRVGSL